MSSSYFKKACESDGVEIKAQSFVLNNVTFGLKSRYTALLELIEGPLANKLKHFVILSSSMTSVRLQQVIQALDSYCSTSLLSITLTDL